MQFKFNLLLCWLGFHRYKVIDATFGFGSSDPIETIQCKICEMKKIRRKR